MHAVLHTVLALALIHPWWTSSWTDSCSWVSPWQHLLKFKDSSAQNLWSSNVQIWWLSWKWCLDLGLICFRPRDGERLWTCLSSHSHSACGLSFSPCSHDLQYIWFSLCVLEILRFLQPPTGQHVQHVELHTLVRSSLFYLFAPKSQLFTHVPFFFHVSLQSH